MFCLAWTAVFHLIHLTQKKTQHTIILPLLNDIGWAVIDYIVEPQNINN